MPADEEDYDYDPSDHNSYTTAEGSSDEEDISYIAKGPSPSQNASAQNASSQNASSQNAKTNGQTPPKPGTRDQYQPCHLHSRQLSAINSSEEGLFLSIS